MKNDYYSHPSGLQCQDFKHYLPSSIGDALKYIWRAGKKNYPNMTATESALADFDKALNYLNYCKEHGVPEINSAMVNEIVKMLKLMMGNRTKKELTNRELLIGILTNNDDLDIQIQAVEMTKELVKDCGCLILEERSIDYDEN